MLKATATYVLPIPAQRGTGTAGTNTVYTVLLNFSFTAQFWAYCEMQETLYVVIRHIYNYVMFLH